MKNEKTALRFFEWLLDGAARVPLRVIWKMADILGYFWYRLDGRHRGIALGNLEIAFGNELDAVQRETICRGNFEHLARVTLELPYVRRLTSETLDSLIGFDGMEHYETALRKGKGLLMITSHSGNWELMALAFCMRYHPFHLVVRPLDNPVANRLVDEMRCKSGNKTIPKKEAPRQLLRLLRKREIIGILIDQNVDWYHGVFVPFFRDIACTSKAIAVLALKMDAPVIPVFNYRMADGRYCLTFKPEVKLTRTGDTTRDIEENTALFNKEIEAHVRKYPEQWLWIHRRWKTRPYRAWPRTNDV